LLPTFTTLLPAPVFTLVTVVLFVLCTLKVSLALPRLIFITFTFRKVMPTPMPKPVRVVEVSVPLRPVVSPVSSTLTVFTLAEPKPIKPKKLGGLPM